MSSFGSDTPFMLLAKLKVKEDKVSEYLEIADKTAIAKTSGGVRRITPRESLGSDLSLLIIFIVYQYVGRSFLTAELKDKFGNP